MREAVKQIVEITTSTKSGFVGVIITWISTFWMTWGSVLVSALTAIGGLIYIYLMIMLKWQEYKKTKRENNKITGK